MTSERVKLAIIGAGAIGGVVCRKLLAGSVDRIELVGVLTRRNGSRLPEHVARFDDLATLLARGPAIVVEAASHGAVREYGPQVVGSGATLICTSVGALTEPGFLCRLERIALERGGRIVIPCGAIGALDILRASAQGGLDTVEVEQRKPAAALLPRADAERLGGPTTVFTGVVADAVRLYPATTNVLAAVALAGVGTERTRVVIIADPTIDANEAALRAAGTFGSFEFRISNRPSANPRTSAVTAHSIISTLKNLCGVTAVPG